MMNKGFDVPEHLVALWYRIPVVVSDIAAGRHVPGGLLDNPDALAHFLDPHQVARIAVALGRRGDLEFIIVIARVGKLLPKVPLKTACPQVRPGDPPVHRLFQS